MHRIQIHASIVAVRGISPLYANYNKADVNLSHGVSVWNLYLR